MNAKSTLILFQLIYYNMKMMFRTKFIDFLGSRTWKNGRISIRNTCSRRIWGQRFWRKSHNVSNCKGNKKTIFGYLLRVPSLNIHLNLNRQLLLNMLDSLDVKEQKQKKTNLIVLGVKLKILITLLFTCQKSIQKPKEEIWDSVLELHLLSNLNILQYYIERIHWLLKYMGRIR